VQTQGPRFFVGYGVALATLMFCGVMSIVFAIGLNMENKYESGGRGTTVCSCRRRGDIKYW
jgi:hypothetical protein